MISLRLYGSVVGGDTFVDNLHGKFSSWRRTSRAVGGYHVGKMTVRNRGIHELTHFYNTWMGRRIVETCFGMISYEGFVWQIDMIKNGINYRRTLNPQSWRNRVKVKYTDANDENQEAAWAENTSSSDIYGEMEHIISIGDATSSEAAALRDRELIEHAWPTSKSVGGVNVGSASAASKDGLVITTVGYFATLNWQYRETESTAAADSLLSTLIGETEFVSAGRIESNSLSVTAGDDDGAARIGDLIEYIISRGDSSGNIWKGGVYENREFLYEQSSEDILYSLHNGQLLHQAGGKVMLPLLKPGFYVRDANAPAGAIPPGTSNIWDDPQVAYCNEIEFSYPNQFVLKFPGERLLPLMEFTQFEAPANQPPGGIPPAGDDPAGDDPNAGNPMLPWVDPNPPDDGGGNVSNTDPYEEPLDPGVIGKHGSGDVAPPIIGDPDTENLL